jgi:hypothetical protein
MTVDDTSHSRRMIAGWENVLRADGETKSADWLHSKIDGSQADWVDLSLPDIDIYFQILAKVSKDQTNRAVAFAKDLLKEKRMILDVKEKMMALDVKDAETEVIANEKH